jgi:hypothetical protein
MRSSCFDLPGDGPLDKPALTSARARRGDALAANEKLRPSIIRAVANLVKHVEVGTLLALPRREPISGRDRTPFLGKSKRKFKSGAQSRA